MSRSLLQIRLVPYESKYRDAFKALNESWIREFFKMEPKDYDSLLHPERTIIAKGGEIIVALLGEEAVGVCALMCMDHPDYDFELAKMGVAENVRGKGIGYQLGKEIIARARNRGARNLFVESNTILVPAISLYRKLGFQEIAGKPSPYERSNIQMLIDFESTAPPT